MLPSTICVLCTTMPAQNTHEIVIVLRSATGCQAFSMQLALPMATMHACIKHTHELYMKVCYRAQMPLSNLHQNKKDEMFECTFFSTMADDADEDYIATMPDNSEDEDCIDEDEVKAHQVAASLFDLNQKPAESLKQKLTE